METRRLPHKEFFALRNGILADAVRKAGCPCARIFGLNVPQIAEIAKMYGYDNNLAYQLWDEKDCRESRLLACYLFDPQSTNMVEALRIAEDIQSVEEADMLSFRLLKRIPAKIDILNALKSRNNEGNVLQTYLVKVLTRHLE
ncbi:MAG: DNA alkylation repair protein [Prevotella sp.]|nr:DNA alkylation repair protein [Bacteroides sp.]MCM1366349.1 DNA alkylation repair protein [Prevotella sp.]MCM1436293.1 DNA alkylation repair protein [Prevotella sp.]